MDWNDKPFDQPFYYGRLGNMVLLYVFDKPHDLRFFVSPSGGGLSLRADGGVLDPDERDAQGRPVHPELSCPAWDFLWVIPEERLETGRAYHLRMRALYKPFESNEDVLAEARQAQQEMEFEEV
jgi:hypothetical protein